MSRRPKAAPPPLAKLSRRETAMLHGRKAVEALIAEMQADLLAEAEEVGAAFRMQTSATPGRATARAVQAQACDQAGKRQTGNSKGCQQ